jgi:hypothetical protein
MLAMLVTISACITTETGSNKWSDMHNFQYGLIDQEQMILDELPRASYYNINLTISSDYLSINGNQQVYYTNTEDVTLDSIYFYLFPNIIPETITVSNTMVDDERVDIEYLFSATVIRIPLPQPLEPDDEIIIQMDYEIQLTPQMNQHYSLMGYVGGVLLLDGFYPVIPVFDNGDWNVAYPPINGDKTFLDTSYYQVKITAPMDLIMVATGNEADRKIEEDNQVVTFAAGPSRDFCIIASDHFLVTSMEIGQTTVNSYFTSVITEEAEQALSVAIDAIESFNNRLGAYPFTELDIVSLPLPDYILGVEYPGVIGINVDIYSQSRYLDATVAHEIGHQWFYNVLGNDQVNEPWLDEALVQYITGLYFLDVYGQDGWQVIRDSWISRWDRVDREIIPLGMPSDYYEGREYGAIIYGRGPLFIEALAETMGQPVFSIFLVEYYNSNKWKIVYTDTFCETAEKICNCELETIFNDWLFSD